MSQTDGRINIVKIILLHKAIYRFNAIPIKLPMIFSTELEICMEDPKEPKQSWGKNWSWRNQAPWLKTILQSYSYQNSMVMAQKQKYKAMKQDRMSRDKPIHLWPPNLWQRRQEYTIEKIQSFQWVVLGKLDSHMYYKRMKLEHFLTLYTKINSKWIKDLNVRLDTIKLLEGNTGRTLSDINHSKFSFDSLASNGNKKNKQWDLLKLKSFYIAKETINKKTTHRLGENIYKWCDW